jgi:hypothetical protein
MHSMRPALFPIAVLSAMTFVACTPSAPNATAGESAEDGTPRNVVAQGDPRDNWQRPEEIFRSMGGITGKTVADLFAGDGYMAFHMVQAGARKVIAMDTEAGNVAAMKARKEELGIPDSKLEIRQATPGETGLGMEEVEICFIFNRYTTIQDRAAFMRKVRASTRSPRTVYIIDFLVAETPVGPPVSQRMNDAQMMDELGEFDYTDMGARGDILPYQYILFAQDYVEGAEYETGPLQEE